MNSNHAKVCGSPEWAAHLQQDVLPAVTAGIDLCGEMLEIGPGPGAATAWLQQRVTKLTALESDAIAVDDVLRFTARKPADPTQLWPQPAADGDGGPNAISPD